MINFDGIVTRSTQAGIHSGSGRVSEIGVICNVSATAAGQGGFLEGVQSLRCLQEGKLFLGVEAEV